jgi:GlpG protein
VLRVYTSVYGVVGGMSTVRALTLAADVDLAVFSAYLWQQHLRHRVFEEQGRQVLEVATETDAEKVRADYAAWRDGRLTLQRLPRPSKARRAWWPVVRRYPVVTLLIGAALLCLPATWPLESGALGPMLPWLTIVPVEGREGDLHYGTLREVMAQLQVWRFVTPIFIHFGIVHFAFNAAVVVEFGRRIERGAGSWVLLLLVLLIAVVSDVAQFVVTQAPLFGGLSGVAYGLFAYVATRGRLDRAPVWQVNPSFSIGVVVILVLMTTGVTEAFGLYIANTVHWVGLGLGVLAALLWRPTRVDLDGN